MRSSAVFDLWNEGILEELDRNPVVVNQVVENQSVGK